MRGAPRPSTAAHAALAPHGREKGPGPWYTPEPRPPLRWDLTSSNRSHPAPPHDERSSTWGTIHSRGTEFVASLSSA